MGGEGWDELDWVGGEVGTEGKKGAEGRKGPHSPVVAAR